MALAHLGTNTTILPSESSSPNGATAISLSWYRASKPSQDFKTSKPHKPQQVTRAKSTKQVSSRDFSERVSRQRDSANCQYERRARGTNKRLTAGIVA
eukprot:423682-Amphidinium_carterae.1